MSKTLNELYKLKKRIEDLITEWEEKKTFAEENNQILLPEGPYIKFGDHHGVIRRAIIAKEGNEFIKNAPKEEEIQYIFEIYSKPIALEIPKSFSNSTLDLSYEDELIKALEASKLEFEQANYLKDQEENQLQSALQVSRNISSNLHGVMDSAIRSAFSATALHSEEEDINAAKEISYNCRIAEIRSKINELLNLNTLDFDEKDQDYEIEIKEHLLLATTELHQETALIAEIKSLLDIT